MTDLYFWFCGRLVCSKAKQQLVPLVGDRIFLDEPNPQHWEVIHRQITYTGKTARVEVYLTRAKE